MTPKIAFLFPLRWLTDKQDRMFFEKNLKKSIEHRVGSDNLDLLKNVFAYRAVLNLFSHTPLKTPLTKAQLEKYLQELMPAGRCIDLEFEYTQNKSKTMNPACELRFYF